MSQCNCGCGEKKKLVFACSGAADVGELSDRVARKLREKAVGGMFCLAAIGAGVPSYLETAKEAYNIVIDGCPVACGKKMFESKGIAVQAFVLTDLMGLEKGKSPASDALVQTTADKIIQKLATC